MANPLDLPPDLKAAQQKEQEATAGFIVAVAIQKDVRNGQTVVNPQGEVIAVSQAVEPDRNVIKYLDKLKETAKLTAQTSSEKILQNLSETTNSAPEIIKSLNTMAAAGDAMTSGIKEETLIYMARKLQAGSHPLLNGKQQAELKEKFGTKRKEKIYSTDVIIPDVSQQMHDAIDKVAKTRGQDKFDDEIRSLIEQKRLIIDDKSNLIAFRHDNGSLLTDDSPVNPIKDYMEKRLASHIAGEKEHIMEEVTKSYNTRLNSGQSVTDQDLIKDVQDKASSYDRQPRLKEMRRMMSELIQSESLDILRELAVEGRWDGIKSEKLINNFKKEFGEYVKPMPEPTPYGPTLDPAALNAPSSMKRFSVSHSDEPPDGPSALPAALRPQPRGKAKMGQVA